MWIADKKYLGLNSLLLSFVICILVGSDGVLCKAFNGLLYLCESRARYWRLYWDDAGMCTKRQIFIESILEQSKVRQRRT